MMLRILYVPCLALASFFVSQSSGLAGDLLLRSSLEEQLPKGAIGPIRSFSGRASVIDGRTLMVSQVGPSADTCRPRYMRIAPVGFRSNGGNIYRSAFETGRLRRTGEGLAEKGTAGRACKVPRRRCQFAVGRLVFGERTRSRARTHYGRLGAADEGRDVHKPLPNRRNSSRRCTIRHMGNVCS